VTPPPVFKTQNMLSGHLIMLRVSIKKSLDVRCIFYRPIVLDRQNLHNVRKNLLYKLDRQKINISCEIRPSVYPLERTHINACQGSIILAFWSAVIFAKRCV
jgi:hypothetical protein